MLPGTWLVASDSTQGLRKEDFSPRGDGWISCGSSMAFLGADKPGSGRVMRGHGYERTTKALIEHLP